MASALQFLTDRFVNATLQAYHRGERSKGGEGRQETVSGYARCVDYLLDIHTKMENIEKDLKHRLHLSINSGGTDLD